MDQKSHQLLQISSEILLGQTSITTDSDNYIILYQLRDQSHLLTFCFLVRYD